MSLPDDRGEQVEQAAQAAGPVDRECPLALSQREGLEHARQAEDVIRMEVGDQQLLELDEADRAHQLALGSLATVHEQAVATAAHERGGQAAPRAG